MALAILDYNSNKNLRDLHLFDSFEGLPNPVAKEYQSWMKTSWGIDEKDADGCLKKSNLLYATKEEAENVIYEIAKYPSELVHFHVGWFQNTVPESIKSINKIALLRLDGDLYESTIVCLKYLYPLVVNGGFIIIDDYGLNGCRMAIEEFFVEKNINPFLHYVDGLGRYFIKKD